MREGGENLVAVHFELFVQRNKASSWTLEFATEDRVLVLETADEILRDKRAIAVRVMKETLNHATGTFDSFMILKKGDDSARAKPRAETPTAPLCVGPPDLYTIHAREQIGRVLEDWLKRRRVTPFELLHRIDLAEQLDVGMDLQHAIQKISIPEAQARGVSTHEVMRHYRKLADAAIARLDKTSRRGFVDLAQVGFGKAAAALRTHPDGAFQLSGAVAARLKAGQSWSEKVDILLTLADAAPEEGRASAFAVLVQPLSEILGSRAGLADFAAGGQDLGGLLALMTRLVACAEVDRMVAIDASLGREFPALTPQILHLAGWLQDPAFAPVRSALSRRILLELNGPRRLRPNDAQGEITLLRALAMVLTAFAGQILTPDDVQQAFTERSRNLISPEFVASYVGEGAAPLEEVKALGRLSENLVGGANKRAAGKWILAAVGALKFERHLREGRAEPDAKLASLADLRRALDRVALPEADHAVITKRIGEVAGLIDQDARYVARIAKSPAPAAQRLARLLGLANGRTAPLGPVSAHAQAEIDKIMACPQTRAEVVEALSSGAKTP